MRRSRDRVGGYRGRRTLTDMLTILALVLAVLVALLLGGLLLGQRYIVYTDDGFRLDLPFFQKEPDSAEAAPGDISMVERPSASSEESEPDPDPEPEPEAFALSAVQLPLETVLDGTAAQQLEQTGANGLILEMKTAEGTLNWVSQQPLAVSLGVNGQDPAVNEALRRWNQGEVYTVARVYCFRDNTAPYQRNNLALRASYGNWRDELGLRWMNPSSEEACSYLAELCGELAELGFDEILLECGSYPTGGNQEAITSDTPQGRGPAVEQFLTQVRQAVESYGTQVSLRVEPAVLAGEDVLSGLTAETLDSLADRIWTEPQGLEAGQNLLDQSARESEGRLVCLRTVLETEEAGAQAVLGGDEVS